MNVRNAMESFSEPRLVAIALDTKVTFSFSLSYWKRFFQGPEIRTGLLTGGGSAEIDLKKGSSIRLTTDPKFENSGTAVNLFVDYKNIAKVREVRSR